MSAYTRLIKNSLAWLGAALALSTSAAQTAKPPVHPDTDPYQNLSKQAELYARVKHFDFDERKLGNYEDTPMHWIQQQGDGLPTLFARGQLDDRVGHAAPPSFRLNIATGSVGFEYRHLDLTVVPESDYSLVGYIRPQNLRFASAFVMAYFIDRFGEPIPGSQRVSQVVRATGQEPEPWQRVSVNLAGGSPLAYALRLQFWILQDAAWQNPGPREIDPIVRRDVYASAWFDDFSIYRLPRVNLRLSNPAGLVNPGRREDIVVDVNNATSRPLQLALAVTDQDGQPCHATQFEVPPTDTPSDLPPDRNPTTTDAASGELTLAAFEQRNVVAIREPLPPLPPGFYSAQLRVLGGTETLLTRSTNFAVLPPLPDEDFRYLDLGVDLGPWQRSDLTGLTQLLTGLGCGAVKIGVPMVGDIEGREQNAYFQQLNTLTRLLAENRIDVAGVMLAPTSTSHTKTDNSIRQLVSTGDDWRDLVGPVLARVGALLPTWQLGSEAIELQNAQLWKPADVERIRRHLRTFVSIPKLAIPQPVTAVSPPNEDIISVWIPANLPTRTLPRLLDFLISPNPSAYWLQLAPDADSGLNNLRRTDNLARRLVLAKALSPGRVFVPAPFELSERGGQPAWQPTEDYLVYRTLFHYLSGKTAVAAMTPAPNTPAILFQGPDSSCLVVWSWQEHNSAQTLQLYLGPSPHAVTVHGQRQPLAIKDGRTQIPVAATPLIIDALDTPLALLQSSYRVVPTYVQLHTREPRPVVTFRNTYDAPLSGELRLTPPGDWQVKPIQRSFVLAPGETFAEPLTLTLPPRQMAQTHDLDVHLILHAPEATELHFPESLTVGLRDIGLEALAYWEGQDLILKQSLMNLSNQSVSFNAYCEPPGRARQERFFNQVAPGEAALQTYLFPNARYLAGQRIPMGIAEINGARNLNQFAEVPQ